jgi:hypothetical protein
MVREGGVLLEDKPEERLEKLMSFIISGKLEKGENVVLPIGKQGEFISPQAVMMEAEAIKTLSGKHVQGTTARTVSWVFIGTGGALGLGGGLIYAHSVKPALDAKEILKRHGGNEAQAHNSSDGFLYRSALSKKQGRQTAAITLGVSGVASLATGLILFFAFPPKAEGAPQLSIAPHFGADVGGVALMGRF